MFLENKDKNFIQEKITSYKLIITNSAAKQINHLIKNDKNMIGLRLNIIRSGCAGFSYKLHKVTQKRDTDIIYEYKLAKIYISKNIMYLIDGTNIDYVSDGFNYIFKFNNPKAKHICGCGSSFNFM